MNTTATTPGTPGRSPKLTNADLAALALGRGPFVSIYLDLSAERRESLVARISAVADGLLALGADPALVKRATSPFLAPPADRAAMAVIAASDGRSLISSSPEPLARDLSTLSAIPRLAPLIEWSQQAITHVVVRQGERGDLQLTVFDADGTTRSAASPVADDNSEVIARITTHEPAAVFVVGDAAIRLLGPLREAIVTNELRPDCRLIQLEPGSDTEVADAVVRHTASVVAERKVELLHDFRFERSHDNAVEGIDAVVAAANERRVATLLVNADPDDHRRLLVEEAGTLAPLPDEFDPDDPTAEPLADALIWRTLRHGGNVVVLPTTGERGPDDDVGAFLHPRPASLLEG